MPEHVAHYGWLLAAAAATAVAGMGWLALSMDVHAGQAWRRAPSASTRRVLRVLGWISIAVSFQLCLQADHPTMAVLVWVMCLSGGALASAFLLSTRPHWLCALAPWVRAR